MSLFFDNTDKVVAVANTTTAREAFFLLFLYILTLLLLLFDFDCIVELDSLYLDCVVVSLYLDCDVVVVELAGEKLLW